MDEIGLAYILEKKAISVDGEILLYYEIIDVSTGFCFNFNNRGNKFVSLNNGTNYGKSLSCGFNKSYDYVVFNFTTFLKLARDNNYNFDIDKFRENYIKNIGVVLEYTDNGFVKITDKSFLDLINKNKKDYDGTILKTETVKEGGAATAPENPVHDDYEFVTVTELLSRDGTPPENCVNYRSDMKD